MSDDKVCVEFVSPYLGGVASAIGMDVKEEMGDLTKIKKICGTRDQFKKLVDIADTSINLDREFEDEEWIKGLTQDDLKTVMKDVFNR